MLNTQDKSQEILDLYRTICKFNFFKDLDSLHQDLKVNIELDQLPRGKSQDFQNVPLQFVSVQSYIHFWKALFIEELKGYVASSRAAESSPVQKFNLESYFELSSFKVMEFKRVRKTEVTYSSNSIIVLSPEKALGDDKRHPHLVGITYKHDSNVFVRVILGQGFTSEGTEAWKIFTTTKQWYLQQLCSIASIERQFKALCRINQLQDGIKSILLNPQQFKEQSSKRFIIPEALDKKLTKNYNSSQYEAITSSLKQEGITLIQGPPGTGKTKTVLGTLSVLLQSSTNKDEDEELPLLMRWKTSEKELKDNTYELNPWLKEDYEDWRDQPFLTDYTQQLQLTKSYATTKRKIVLQSRNEQITAPAKVLVCGPSNASVDEVIRKLIKQRLLDGKGKEFIPKFVRVGQNYHEELQEHSLDVMAIKQQKIDKTDLTLAKRKILKECQLVFTTLSSSGSAVLESSQVEFDTVVIDESGQAVEISSLIPLIYGCKRLILIGDPKQLPATVFSPVCLQHHYDQSLFERLMKSNYPVSLLKVQYRMHPQISKVIASSFYDGLLQDGQTMTTEPRGVPKAFMMVHIGDSSQIFGEQSYYNPTEGQCVKLLVNWLSKDYKNIGVLSPYSAQVKWLANNKVKAEVKTIDSFQGRQKDVIIFSAVRASKMGKERKMNPKKTIGFVSDGRRLNVALSRAKEVCIVVGDLERLQISKVWKTIINEAKKRECVFKVSCLQELRQAGEGMSKLRLF